jgi:hypothetical protein
VEVELELELETATTPTQSAENTHHPRRKNRSARRPSSKRGWVDRNEARAIGADRFWAEKLGEKYWAAKKAFLEQHPMRRVYFWSRLDALELGQFLTRRPDVQLEDIRGMLINYHASEKINPAAAAEKVFAMLQDYVVMNPAHTHQTRQRWNDKATRSEQEAATMSYWDRPEVRARVDRETAALVQGWEGAL